MVFLWSCHSVTSYNSDSIINYIIAQVNSKKKLKPSDIIKFAWEKEHKNTHTKTANKQLTADDVENIKAMALQREKKLKEKGII